nr:hypothetical protein [Tanacetum cinerariifolium]
MSKVQLEHEKVDEFVVAVVKEDGGEGDCKYTLGGKGGESFWEGGDDFGVDVLCFHTCLTDILGFLERLEWWFEQAIDKEEERFEEDKDGSEGRFVTAVKLNRGLRNSTYDQLYAYLKQHETHVNENKMMLDRFTQHTLDPLALMSNVSHQQHYSQSSSTPPFTYVPPHLADNAHLDSGNSPTDNLIENLTNTLALLTQSYKTFLPQTNNQLRTSSNTRNQATVQDDRVVVAIGYKNPLCLTHTKQVQPALYNSHVIIKDNHVLAIVHNIEDTLGIAEITMRKMNDKMKDPECVTHKVCLSEGDIYDDPSRMRFYQNDDVPLWGNRKQKGEGGPEWVVRSKFKDELANFMLKKQFHMKGIGEMLYQYRKEMHE